MEEMSLDIQKQKMLEMKGMLGDFCIMLDNVMDTLSCRLESLAAQGVPSEIARYYSQMYYTPEKREIDNLIRTIQTAQFGYIDEVIADIDKALSEQ